jgi:hypothetical protein
MKATANLCTPCGQHWVRDANAGSGMASGRREPARVQQQKGLQEVRSNKRRWLVEVRPEEELPSCLSLNLHRIFVPTALDEASVVAVEYALCLALGFDSELALLYTLEDPYSAQNSRAEAELWRCFSALRLRHRKIRLFLRPGPTGEQVKSVANAVGADLIVTSRDYHRRFLSCLTHRETDAFRVEGVACPVVLVNARV